MILMDITRNLMSLPLDFLRVLADFDVKILPVRRGQCLVGTPLAAEIKDLSAFRDRNAIKKARDILSSSSG